MHIRSASNIHHKKVLVLVLRCKVLVFVLNIRLVLGLEIKVLVLKKCLAYITGLYHCFQMAVLLTGKPLLGRSLSLLQNIFWPSYCQISTDLDKILHTHTHTDLLLCRIHLWADLDHDRRVGGFRPNQNDCFL